jgi:hypothetical protein
VPVSLLEWLRSEPQTGLRAVTSSCERTVPE